MPTKRRKVTRKSPVKDDERKDLYTFMRKLARGEVVLPPVKRTSASSKRTSGSPRRPK
jgi:hypothetical protein